MKVKDLILKDDFVEGINDQVWHLNRIEKHSWEISAETARNGESSLKVTLYPGDKVATGRDNQKTERAEISEREEIFVPLNSNIWYAFSFYFPDDFPILDNRLVFAQWKQFYKEEKQSPFMSFRCINGQLSFRVVGNNNLVKKYFWGKDPKGKWHDAIVNYQLNDSLEGAVNVWIDNELLTNYQGAFGFDHINNFTYFKMGLYRDSVDIPQTIYLGRFRRGPTRRDCED